MVILQLRQCILSESAGNQIAGRLLYELLLILNCQRRANVEIMSNAIDGPKAFKYQDTQQLRYIRVQNQISSKYNRFQ